ncbi:hypothetical protein RZS08_62505, partial [Arthrospira platensis SPKY1]|nr:hypothetical protein [Arthrospira platensis SPKY1]
AGSSRDAQTGEVVVHDPSVRVQQVHPQVHLAGAGGRAPARGAGVAHLHVQFDATAPGGRHPRSPVHQDLRGQALGPPAVGAAAVLPLAHDEEALALRQLPL